jgi:hypothetical protein
MEKENESVVEAESREQEVTSGDVANESPVERMKRKVNVKLAITLAVIVVLLALGYSMRGLFIVATVNGSPISRFAVIRELEKASGEAVLSTLVSQKLLADEFKKSGAVIAAEEVDAEVEKIQSQLSEQGAGTLDELLVKEGLTMTDLRKQITIQKQVEKVLGDKIAVSEEEVTAYITQNKLEIPEEQMAAARTEIMNQMKQQKVALEGGTLLERLRSEAKINYLVAY